MSLYLIEQSVHDSGIMQEICQRAMAPTKRAEVKPAVARQSPAGKQLLRALKEVGGEIIQWRPRQGDNAGS
jgi:hypothetical protein